MRKIVPGAGFAVLAVAAFLVVPSLLPTDQPETGTVVNAGASDTIPGLYVVGLDGAPADRSKVRADASSLASRYGGQVGYVYSAALRGFSVRMSAGQAERLAADPAVDFVQQSVRVHVEGEQTNPASWGLAQIDAKPGDGKYTFPNRGAGVHIYNTDTELRIDHQAFGGRAQSGWDFIGNDPNVNDCKKQTHVGHGTHTAGTSSSGPYGVAKAVTVVGVKMMSCAGSGPDTAAIAAIDWVTANAKLPAVANASWGVSDDGPGVVEAMNNSIDAGIVWVTSAGNSRDDACNHAPGGSVPRALTVAATTRDHTEPRWTNYGPCVDIFAPGANIVSAANYDTTSSRLMSGTSMAAPHVTGAAAIYLHRFPNATPAQVHAAIVGGARHGFVKNLTSVAGSPDAFLNVQNLW